jgi:hypothetical protein
MTDFVGAARPITANEVAAQANIYHLELAALRAVMAVESRNSGFDSRRRPIILFEPHVFYRNLHGTERDRAEQTGLAYPHWKNSYPSGSDAQYRRLAAAIRINEEAAYSSVSMGLGQVLGENHAMCGCASATVMFGKCMESEANQLECMLEFIKTKHLDRALRAHDWKAFAAGYNGIGQVDRYAAWLSREYKKWARITDKPREDLTAQDLSDAGSKTVDAAETGKKLVATAAVVGPSAGVVLDAATQGVQPVIQAVQTAQSAKGAWDWVSENWQFLAVIGLTALFLVLCYFAYRAFHDVIEQRVQNARDGMNTRF